MEDNKNDSIDQMAESYGSNESDLKAYNQAQAKTIIAQSREINLIKKQKDLLEDQVKAMSLEIINLKATASLGGGQTFQVSDEETVSVIQIAMLRQLAIARELTLEEAKKFELFAKVLREIRGKPVKEEKDQTGKLSNEELLKAMNGMLNEPQ